MWHRMAMRNAYVVDRHRIDFRFPQVKVRVLSTAL
jgi:hypothetical protein